NPAENRAYFSIRTLGSAAAAFRPLRFADGRGLRRGCDGGVLILEPDDIARLDHPRQFDRIPVRQADAAVGLGLANVRRRRGAMDSVGWIGQVDPDQADGIVWARADRELPLRVDALPCKFGIVLVFRVPGNAFDLEVPARRGLFLAADRRWIESKEFAVAVIDAHVSRRLVDYDRHFRQIVARLWRIGRRNGFDGRPAGPQRHLGHVGDGKLRSRPREIRARIELSQQSWAHVELLCEFRLRAGVRETGEPSHRLEV